MLPAHDVHDALAIGVAVAATCLGWRRSRGTALAVVLACEIASNSSLTWLKQPFLAARWAALITLALLIAPEFRRAPRRLILRVGLLAILPALATLSALWSVEPQLTLERAATFAVMLWIVAGYGMSWGIDHAELDGFVDSAAGLSAAVFVVSLAVPAVSSRGLLNGQLRGIFENPNGLGLFLGLTYPFVAAALDRRGIVRTRIAVIAAYGGMAAAAHARGGILALALTGIGFELARRRFVWASAAAAAGAVLIAVALLTTSGTQTTPTKSGGVLSVGAPAASVPLPHGQSFVSRLTGARSEGWRAAVTLIKTKPLEGYGFGTGDRLFSLYSDRVHFEYFEGANPNEAYLQLVLELGVVLAAIVLLPLLGAAVLGARLLAAGRSLSGMSCGLTLLAGLVVGLVESVFTSAGAPWAPLIWVAGAGCVAATLAREHGPASVPISQQPSRRFVPSRRVVGAVLVVTGVAAVSWVFLRPTKPSPLTVKQAIDLVAQRAPCARRDCRVSEVVKVRPGLFWVKLSGPPNVCLIVEPARVSRSTPSQPSVLTDEGIASSTCRPLPLVRSHMLAVGVPASSAPPYFVPPIDDPTGFEPAVIRAIATRLGIGLINWGGASRARPNTKSDVVIDQLVDAWNEPASFLPYLAFRQELVALRGSPAARTRTLAAAARLRLGVSDAYGAAAVAHFVRPRTTVLRFANDDRAVAALRSGRVDAIVIYRQDAVAIVKRFPQLSHVGLLPPDRFLGMQFRAASRLEPLFAAQLRHLESSGELPRLRDETLGPLPAVRSLL
jgi:ABC-type amino acid transport substrate-binding protein/O-antigen ligase